MDHGLFCLVQSIDLTMLLDIHINYCLICYSAADHVLPCCFQTFNRKMKTNLVSTARYANAMTPSPPDWTFENEHGKC